MNVEDVIALRRAVCEEGADHDEKCDDDMRAHGVNGCTLGEILASALLAAETETRERCAVTLEGFKGGFTLTMDGQLVPDKDGPWMLPNQAAAAIRNLPPSSTPTTNTEAERVIPDRCPGCGGLDGTHTRRACDGGPV